jgi:AcrR family transcriptional regulator
MARVTQAHVEAREAQILDAAWDCFARTGYYETTMQDIADAAGLSAGAIYRYYPSKEHVLRAINDRSRATGRAVVAEARSLTDEPLAALRAIGDTMLSVFHDDEFETTARVNVEVWPHILRDEDLRSRMRDELRFWHKTVVDFLTEAKSRGELRPQVEPETLATLVICAFEGLRHYRLVDEKTFSADALIQLVRMVVPEEFQGEDAEGPSVDVKLEGPPWKTRPPRKRASPGNGKREGGGS